MMTWLRGFWKSLFKRRSKHEVEPRIWQAERAASDRGIRPTSRVDGLRYGSTSIHEEARRTQDSERPTSIGEAETVDAAKEIAKVAFTGVSGAGLEPVPETIPQPEDRAGLATASSLFERKRAEAHIQVGLDFGTSCTKVVYRQHGKPFARALGFRNGLPNYPDYCLPSLAAADQGKVLLGEQAARCLLNEPWDSGLQRFKVIVAAEHSAAWHVKHKLVLITRYMIALFIPAFPHGCAVHGSPPCNDYLSSVKRFATYGQRRGITGFFRPHPAPAPVWQLHPLIIGVLSV